MMMVFGLFVFELRTLPYQQLQLSRNWRHVKNDRVGRSAKWQYVGAGENQLTLGGLLYPEITGGNLSLGTVSTMAYAGLAWPLIDGVGSIYGMYVITGLQETHQEFDRYGKAKKIGFTLSLQKVDENIREGLYSTSISNMLEILKNSTQIIYYTELNVLGKLSSNTSYSFKTSLFNKTPCLL
ncbi:phage tail protein [Klebsiella quasipneumoniae]|uniref:phage tail protein n=3 Tax=Klebsiella pneumoniae complex TaxID=3390273 RepID=UPI000A26F2FF|nr:phage tail protein [Klebsiella quasipneumoniae]MCA4032964.1 phage tail protein [Klebsiella quasipneumoniae]MCW9411345.1 phage tail protein [Klebsiella quasipneumoniae]SSD84042.1 putative bacteriophage tail protein [Klebsiella quasipneumoniae]SXD24009.1 putative bacteriophage tail protein [Klebsiella quasipneumoniae]VGL09517.1 putative bacteriophage tail protein [Klebsiella quasipneumoniae]